MKTIYDYCKTSEVAILEGLSIRGIQRRRKKEGIFSKGNGWGGNHEKRPFDSIKVPPNKINDRLPRITDRKVWDNAEWFHEMYVVNRYGIYLISKMICRDMFIVRRKLKRYGIKTRSYDEVVCSKNKCCTCEWLEENYVILGYTIRKCAQMAAVNNYTIIAWLTKFGIKIRDKYEAVAGERSANYGKKKIHI
jgi:hypothetical protein